MTVASQSMEEAGWEIVCSKGIVGCPIQEVRELRSICWPNIYAAGFSLEDGFDDDAWHWTVRVDDQLLAAARLTIHSDLVDVPDSHLFGQLSSSLLKTPIGYISRLVVHPRARGRGLPGVLDKLRLEECRELMCKSAVCVWNPSSGSRRRQQLLDLGFSSFDGESAQADGGFGISYVYSMLL
jgi:GNAT superfamily N-acetyltransferase